MTMSPRSLTWAPGLALAEGSHVQLATLEQASPRVDDSVTHRAAQGLREELCHAPQCHDRQVSSAGVVGQFERQPSARAASSQGPRCRAGRPARPATAWLVAGSSTSGKSHVVDFVRCAIVQRRVRPKLIVPVGEQRQLLAKVGATQRHEEPARATVLECLDESLDGTKKGQEGDILVFRA